MGEGEGGMIWENGIEICIISYMKRVASPGWMLGAGTLGGPRGMVWGGKEGGGFRRGNTSIHVVDSFRCLAKPIQYCKVQK